MYIFCVHSPCVSASATCCTQELDARLRLDAAPARQEILQMCEGMKHITLPVTNNAEVSADMLLHFACSLQQLIKALLLTLI